MRPDERRDPEQPDEAADREAKPGKKRIAPDDEPEKDLVDETSEESFPGSDPPSWTPVSGAGPHGKQT